MDFEKKLAEYRAKQRRQAYLQKARESFKSFFTIRRRHSQMSDSSEKKSDDEVLIVDEPNSEVVSSDGESEDETTCKCACFTIVTYTLYLVLWVTLLIIFVKLQFGLVFVVMSALVAIYLNTRTEPKKKDEVSAYSVFNKNCESIDGTLTAEQFEREIRYGSAAVH